MIPPIIFYSIAYASFFVNIFYMTKYYKKKNAFSNLVIGIIRTPSATLLLA